MLVREEVMSMQEQGHSHACVNQAISALRFVIAKVLRVSSEQAVLENGTDLRFIQELLSHANTVTTEPSIDSSMGVVIITVS
ncbi:Tyrosine recombinase XerC [compost metagenome]